jgi:hypothetical protein
VHHRGDVLAHGDEGEYLQQGLDLAVVALALALEFARQRAVAEQLRVVSREDVQRFALHGHDLGGGLHGAPRGGRIIGPNEYDVEHGVLPILLRLMTATPNDERHWSYLRIQMIGLGQRRISGAVV